MRKFVSAFGLLAVTALVGPVFGQTFQGANQWPAGYIDPGNPKPPYVTPETPQGTGAYPAIMATDPGAAEFVLYYPANLAALGPKKMPILVWANGSCAYRGNSFRHFLTEISSHGYLAVAGGTMGTEANETVSMSQNPVVRKPGDPAPPPPAAGAPGRGAADPNRKTVTIDLLKQGIDWAVAENTRQGSKFYGKLDTSKVAVMGMSCGGVVALGAGVDPRASTVGIWDSGTTMIGNQKDAATANRDKLHTSVLYISGDADLDIGYAPAHVDFAAINNLPVFYGWEDHLAHLGTFRQTDGGEEGKIATAWLDWQLKGDQTAAKMFKGADCTLCKEAGWHVQKKKID